MQKVDINSYFSSLVPRNGIPGAHRKCRFSCLRNCHTLSNVIVPFYTLMKLHESSNIRSWRTLGIVFY